MAGVSSSNSNSSSSSSSSSRRRRTTSHVSRGRSRTPVRTPPRHVRRATSPPRLERVSRIRPQQLQFIGNYEESNNNLASRMPILFSESPSPTHSQLSTFSNSSSSSSPLLLQRRDYRSFPPFTVDGGAKKKRTTSTKGKKKRTTTSTKGKKKRTTTSTKGKKKRTTRK